ncbi:MAG: PEP-CTERM sorting domain-containing protein [Pirellula sp.]
MDHLQYGFLSSQAVPEPTSMAIFGLGALGLAYRARRRM